MGFIQMLCLHRVAHQHGVFEVMLIDEHLKIVGHAGVGMLGIVGGVAVVSKILVRLFGWFMMPTATVDVARKKR